MTWLATTLAMYGRSFRRAGELTLRNWPVAVDNTADAVAWPFYALVPEMLFIPVVVLAALVTVVAISGAFSLTRQGVQLGFLPRVQIRHSDGTTTFSPGTRENSSLSNVATR